MALLDEIAGYLAAEGVAGGSTGWTLSGGRMPSEPDRVVGVFQGVGGPAETKFELRRPGLQVRIRGGKNDYAAAAEKANEVFRTLHAKTQLRLGDAFYVHIIARGDILALGYDANDRPEFTVNFSTTRKEAGDG